MALWAQKDPNTVIMGDLNTPLSTIDRSSSQKINKETSELLHTLDQMTWLISTKYFTQQLGNTYSAAHGTFSKIDHILRHKPSLN
jgi:hypothetical protein